jgi:16S rRNA (guanine1207-N2)-methyltransferase
MRDALKTLLYPFDADVVPSPATGERILFLGAEAGFRTSGVLREAEVTCIQGFRPLFRELEAAGQRATPLPAGEEYNAALVLCGRHRGQNETWLAEAVLRTRVGGLVVAAGGKDDGMASLRKRLETMVELGGHLPKFHGLAVWFRRPQGATPLLGALGAGKEAAPVEGHFATAPGMFSHDRVDAGSRLLVEHFPSDISGQVADFCAGWGYLARDAVRRCPKIKAIDLYEADFASLEAARINLADATVPVGFFWHDLATERVNTRYDAIVMNPPFHTERRAEPSLGHDMIKAAAKALKSGGRLFLVANHHLPYEKTMPGLFSSFSEIGRAGGFKVILAKK